MPSMRMIATLLAPAMLALAQAAAAAPSFTVTDTRYDGFVSADAFWVESVGAPTGSVNDSESADTFILAGGIGAGAPGVAAQSSATAFGSIGLGVGGGGAVDLNGRINVQGTTYSEFEHAYSEAWASSYSNVAADFTIANDTTDPVPVYIYWKLEAGEPDYSNTSGLIRVELQTPVGQEASEISEELLMSNGTPPANAGGIGYWTTLAPGDYTVSATADLFFAEAQGGDTENVDASFRLYVGFAVPEPGSLATLCLGGLLIARRRRL